MDFIGFRGCKLWRQTLSKAEQDGIILYSTDGYENKTADTLTAEDFDQNSYHKQILRHTMLFQLGTVFIRWFRMRLEPDDSVE